MGRKLFRWILLGTLAATVFAVTSDARESTVVKPYLLLIGGTALFFCSIYGILSRPIVGVRFQRHHLAFFLYACSSALSLLLAQNVDLFRDRVLELVALLVIASSAAWLFQSERERVVLERFLLMLASAACLLGIGLYTGLPLLGRLSERMSSTFGNANFFSGFLAMMLPLSAAAAMREGSGRLMRRLSAGGVLLIASSLLITGSRSAWIGGSVGLAIVAFVAMRRGMKRWVFFTLILCAAAGVLFLANNAVKRQDALRPGTSSIERRLFIYDGAWKAFRASPVIGEGLGNFSLFLPNFRSPDYWMAKSEDVVPHAHNELLELLSETGILGCLAFLGILLLFVAAVLKSPLAERSFVVGCGAAVAACLVDNMASTNLHSTPVAVTFWMLLGAGFSRSAGTAHTDVAIPRSIRALRFLLPVPFLIILLWLLPQMADRYSAERHFYRGAILRWKGDPAADEEFRRTLELVPSHAEARIYLADDLLKQSRNREAREQIDTLLKMFPYYPKARIVSSLAASASGDTSGARSAIGRELELESTPQALFTASEIERKAGNHASAFHYSMELLNTSLMAGADEFVAEGLRQARRTGGTMICQPDVAALADEVLKAFPADAAARVEVAWARAQCGRGGTAVALLRGLEGVRLSARVEDEKRELEAFLAAHGMSPLRLP